MMKRAWTAGMLLASTLACGQPSGPGELVRNGIPASRPAAPAIPGATPEQRHFGRSSAPGPASEQASGGAPDLASLLDYDLPPGWEEVPPTQMRLINLRPAGDPDAECYLALLPSSGGGVAANVNRWRGQLGLEPLDEEGLNALPHLSLLGAQGVLVDFEGAYAGMGGEARPDWRLTGLIVPIPGQTLFVKMTGPSALIAGERQNFESFCTSLRPSRKAQEMRGQDAAGAGDAAPTGDLTWEAPETWQDQGARTMRLVSYQVAPGTECYLALARGDRLSNYNRWRGQVGQGPMTQAEIDALPTVSILGEDCPLLEVTGEYRGMSGEARPNTTLLGTMRELGDQALFVKLVGPAAEVEAARGDFETFCASIGER